MRKANKTIIGLACLIVAAATMVLAQNSPSTESILLGKWDISIGKYQDTWTFKEGGAVASAKQPYLKGVWTKETNCILIQWEEREQGYNTWEAFTLPLKEDGAQGGNWKGLAVLAKKIK